MPGPSNAPVDAHRWPLRLAAAAATGLVVAAAVVAYVGNALDNVDPNGTGPDPYHGLTRFLLFLVVVLVIAAIVSLGRGVGDWREQRRSQH